MPDDGSTPELFGANAWLVDEMDEQYRQDPGSVTAGWRDFFEGYRPGGVNLARPSLTTTAAAPTAVLGAAPAPIVVSPPAPKAPAAANGVSGNGHAPAAGTPIRGAAARIVANMEASLEVPTATSFRVVPARLLEVNRRMLNDELSRSGSSGKVSFTHLIGFAIVEAIAAVPALNSTFFAPDDDGPKTPATVLHHEHLGLGIAVDSQKADGSRTLMVPVVRDADTLDFRGFWLAY
jgi:multifunctional 2-oxoglutarate metabolism enzyme